MSTAISDPASWPVLSAIERRLLGVLVEKAKTTPDGYPLSLNSLTTGSNQKSARDPVMNLSDDDVLEALPGLQAKGLVTRIQGGRVERYRHNLYDLWRVSKVELAILAELLLRGPQTEGELRGRASRMEPIDDLDALRAALKPLTERKLVVFLGPEGRRGTLIAHGFHEPRELEVVRQRQASEPAVSEARTVERGSHPDSGTEMELRHQLAALGQQVSELQAALQRLSGEVAELRRSLGVQA